MWEKQRFLEPGNVWSEFVEWLQVIYEEVVEVYFFLILLFKRILCFWERQRANKQEREHEWRGGAEGEGEADSLLQREPKVGLHPETLGSWPELMSWRQMLDQLSHPGSLRKQSFKKKEQVVKTQSGEKEGANFILLSTVYVLSLAECIEILKFSMQICNFINYKLFFYFYRMASHQF